MGLDSTVGEKCAYKKRVRREGENVSDAKGNSEALANLLRATEHRCPFMTEGHRNRRTLGGHGERWYASQVAAA